MNLSIPPELQGALNTLNHFVENPEDYPSMSPEEQAQLISYLWIELSGIMEELEFIDHTPDPVDRVSIYDDPDIPHVQLQSL